MRLKNIIFLFVTIIVFSVFFLRIHHVQFHQDEALDMTMSIVFDRFVRGDFEDPVWRIPGYNERVVAYYIIGLSRVIGGYSEEDLNGYWDYRLSVKENTELGNMPKEDLLWWGRLPSVFFSTLALMFIYWFVQRIAGTAAALTCIGLLLSNSYVLNTLGRAREEAPLLGFSLLIFYFSHKAVDSLSSGNSLKRSISWLLIGAICSGVAGALKLNGAILCLLGPFAVAPFAFRKGMKNTGFPVVRWSRIFYWSIISVGLILIAFMSFVIVNPYLYQSPLKGSESLYKFRIQTMHGQIESFPRNDMRGSELARIKRIASRIFKSHASLGIHGAQYINFSLFLYGMLFTVMRAIQWLKENRNGSHAWVFLLGVSIATSVIVLMLELDWGRFYYMPVIFSTVFISISLANILKLASRTAEIIDVDDRANSRL